MALCFVKGLTCTTNPAVLVYTDEEEGASAKEDNNLALGLGAWAFRIN